jgi:hypothetical protein
VQISLFHGSLFITAEVYVQIYAKIVVDVWLFSINQTFNLSARLQLEGPDFRGLATFKVAVMNWKLNSATIRKSINTALTREEFIAGFTRTCKILVCNIASGIIKKIKRKDGTESIVVNPKTFALEIFFRNSGYRNQWRSTDCRKCKKGEYLSCLQRFCSVRQQTRVIGYRSRFALFLLSGFSGAEIASQVHLESHKYNSGSGRNIIRFKIAERDMQRHPFGVF